MEKNKIEFDYRIMKNGEPLDDCYAFAEFTDDDMEEMATALFEANSGGELTDLPEKYLGVFVDAALDDAADIYPDFQNEKTGYSIMLQRFLPDDMLDFLPEELMENFLPEMFEEAEDADGEVTD